MKKLILLILSLLTAMSFLVSCQDDDIPEGLQIVEVSKEHGFTFYAPENWIIINASTGTDKAVWGAKMSSANNISITLAKSAMPEGDITEYFRESTKEFPEAMKLYVVKEPTKANFGNAKEAYQCIYTYEYEGYQFACMQYFVKNNGDFYIFTYTSYGDVNDEESDFNVYLEDVQLSIDNFLFTEKSGAPAEEESGEYDENGYRLVSDEKIAGFSLYLPREAELISSGAYVTAKIGENSTLYLGKATSTGIQINEYWSNRKSELMRVATDVTEIEVNKINESGKEVTVKLGNLKESKVASYEYTYVMEGVKYHVYQVMGVDNFNGYVFTYTAPEAEYEQNLPVINAILEKVEF